MKDKQIIEKLNTKLKEMVYSIIPLLSNEDIIALNLHESLTEIESFESALALLEQQNEGKSALLDQQNEGKEQDKLYPCPYSKAVNCVLDEPCMVCETFAKYLVGEEQPRFDHSASPTLDNTDWSNVRCIHPERYRFKDKEGYERCSSCHGYV